MNFFQGPSYLYVFEEILKIYVIKEWPKFWRVWLVLGMSSHKDQVEKKELSYSSSLEELQGCM